MITRKTPRRALVARIRALEAEVRALRGYIKDTTGHDVGLDIDLARELQRHERAKS